MKVTELREKMQELEEQGLGDSKVYLLEVCVSELTNVREPEVYSTKELQEYNFEGEIEDSPEKPAVIFPF